MKTYRGGGRNGPTATGPGRVGRGSAERSSVRGSRPTRTGPWRGDVSSERRCRGAGRYSSLSSGSVADDGAGATAQASSSDARSSRATRRKARRCIRRVVRGHRQRCVNDSTWSMLPPADGFRNLNRRRATEAHRALPFSSPLPRSGGEGVAAPAGATPSPPAPLPRSGGEGVAAPAGATPSPPAPLPRSGGEGRSERPRTAPPGPLADRRIARMKHAPADFENALERRSAHRLAEFATRAKGRRISRVRSSRGSSHERRTAALQL